MMFYQFCLAKNGRHNFFYAAHLPSNWLKVPKSATVTDSPVSSFKSLMYLAEMRCDSASVVLVGGHSWSRSCHCAVGMMGVVGTVSLPEIQYVSSRADSRTISVLYINGTITSPVNFFTLRQLVVEVTSTAPSPSSSSRCHSIHEFSECSIFLLS